MDSTLWALICGVIIIGTTWLIITIAERLTYGPIWDPGGIKKFANYISDGQYEYSYSFFVPRVKSYAYISDTPTFPFMKKRYYFMLHKNKRIPKKYNKIIESIKNPNPPKTINELK